MNAKVSSFVDCFLVSLNAFSSFVLCVATAVYHHHKNYTQLECLAQSAVVYWMFGHKVARSYDDVHGLVNENASMRALIECLYWKGVQMVQVWRAQRVSDGDKIDDAWLVLPFMCHAGHHTNYVHAGEDTHAMLLQCEDIHMCLYCMQLRCLQKCVQILYSDSHQEGVEGGVCGH